MDDPRGNTADGGARTSRRARASLRVVALVCAAGWTLLVAALFGWSIKQNEDLVEKCHAQQGYAGGEVRAGLGAAVDLDPYLEASASHRRETIFAHALVWLIGLGALGLAAAVVQARVRERDGALAELRDREERARRLAELLHENERRLIESQRVSRVGSYVLDVRTGVWSASEVLEELFGITPEFPHTTEGWLEIIAPDQRAEMGTYFQDEVLGAKKRFDKVYTIRRVSDGQLRLVHGRGLLEIDGAGHVTAMRGTIQDITEQKALEAKLFHAQKMEAVGQLAGGVAHDFNNILAALLMQTGLLQSEPGLSPDVREGLGEIEQSAQRAAALTRQLLLFGRRQVMRKERLELNALVENLLKMLRRLIGEKIDLVLDASTDPLWIEADPGMIEQVILNLCVNARDAMPDGGRLLLRTQAVRAEEGPGHALLSVIDSGHGMDAHTREHLFEPFFTTKPQGKGSGLGLAIVDGIVEQHHGQIEVESEVGRGTSFHVKLPRTTRAATASAAAQGAPAKGGRERVLLVEDEEQLRRTIARWLTKLGYAVTDAPDADAALAAWARAGGAFDLVLTDMMMPGALTGLELVHRLRAAAPGLRAILMSGYSPEILGGRRPEAEGIALVAKPFEVSVLGTLVRECLDGPAPKPEPRAPASPAALAEAVKPEAAQPGAPATPKSEPPGSSPSARALHR